MQQETEIKIPEFKCKGEKTASMVCTNNQCANPGLICLSEQCECYSLHLPCYTFQMNKLIKKLLAKKKSLPTDVQKVYALLEKNIEEMIDQLSRVRQELLLSKDFFGLQRYQREFYSYIVNNQFEKINGKLIQEVQKENKNEYEAQYMSQDQCQKLIDIQKKKLNLICQAIKQVLGPYSKLLPQDRSKIIEDIKTLEQWIQPSLDKPFKQMKLLYRASQSNFSINDFHYKCDSKSNTLTIIRTQYDKIIGGFNPGKWNQVNGNYWNGSQKKAFIFSLTNNEKYTFDNKNGNYMVYCSPNYGPTFGGGHDLYICNSSHTSNGSYCNFPYNYNNGKYTANQNSYTAFCGSTSGYNFTIKQWEVYEIL